MKTSAWYSLNRPLEGHHPRVGRFTRGRSVTWNRPNFGTSLRCSCGEVGEYTSNEAPSSGGRVAANDAYRLHVAVVLGEDLPSWVTRSTRRWLGVPEEADR